MTSSVPPPAVAPPPPVPPPPTPARASELWRGWPGRFLRIAFAAAPIYWLSRRVTVAEVVDRIVRVGWGGVLLATACGFVAYWIGAWRWRTLMRAYGARTLPSVGTLYRFYLISGWFALLPSGLAGDAVRGYRVREHVPDLTASYTAIVVERVCGFVGLLVIAVVASAFGDAGRDSTVAQALQLCVGAGLVIGAGALLGPYLLATRPALRGLVLRLPLAGAFLVRIPPAASFAGPAVATAQSVVIQGLSVGMVGALLHPLAPSVPTLAWAAVVPFVLLFTFFPITPGGVGQREMLFKFFLGLVGVGSAEAIATALLTFVTVSIPALVGGALYLGERALEEPAAP